MNYYRPIQAVCFALSLLVVSGCGNQVSSGKTEIKLVFWSAPLEKEAVMASLKDFYRTHPDITVKFQAVSSAQYQEMLLTQVAGGSGPDIMPLDQSQLPEFVHRGAVIDLTDMIERDRDFKMDDYFPLARKAEAFNNHIYGVPLDLETVSCLYYNKSLLRKAGVSFPTDNWTWDDLRDAAEKLTIPGENGRVAQWGFYVSHWEMFLYGNGGNYFDDPKHPTKCVLDSPDSVDGVQYLHDLIHKYHVCASPLAMRGTNPGDVTDETLFLSGKLPLYASGVWLTSEFRNIKGFDWDVTLFPKSPSGKRGYLMQGDSLTISRDCKHPREAWEVLKWLAGKSLQRQRAIERGIGIPSLTKLQQEWKDVPLKPSKKRIDKQSLLNALKYAELPPAFPGWGEIQESFPPELDISLCLNSSDVSVKQTLEGLATYIRSKVTLSSKRLAKIH